MAGYYYILSIDGGGIRGVYPAQILKCIEDRLGIPLNTKFSLIAGTSTGSIIGSAVATGKRMDTVLNLYKEHGEQIFSPKPSNLDLKFKALNLLLRMFCSPQKTLKLAGICDSIYSSEHLRKALSEVFGQLKMGEIQIPLILPATDVGNGHVHVIKSNYTGTHLRDKDRSLVEAILASCSAPVYFDPIKTSKYLLADGGLWANNPALCAVIEAQRMGIDFKDIKLLSLGTGTQKTYYGVNADRRWGLMNGWGSKKFLDFIFALQSISVSNYISLLLHKEQVLRIDYESDISLPLDDPAEIDNVISRADLDASHRMNDIKQFLL